MNAQLNCFNKFFIETAFSQLTQGAICFVNTIDLSVAKVAAGASLILSGGALVAKSQILDRPIAYFRGQEKKMDNPTNYKLAALGGIAVGTGLMLMTLGVTEIYNRYTGNLCNYRSDTLCKGNLGIPRDQMPQLNDVVKANFLNTYGDKVNYISIDATQLHASQGEINAKKVAKMVESAMKGIWDPCKSEIITAEGESGEIMIVDGHHRAAACFEMHSQIPIAHIRSNIRQVLDYANQFQDVEHHAFDQFKKN